MNEKVLGKITSVSFGYGGYNDAMMALNLTFEGPGFVTTWAITGGWAPSIIEWTDRCKWTEEERLKQQADMVCQIDKLLKDAKINSINELKNKPVELEFEKNTLKSWRILKEVL